VRCIGGGLAHERSPAVVALADGGVVEVGSHDQLMAAKGFGHDRCMSLVPRWRSARRRSSQSNTKLTRGVPGAVATGWLGAAATHTLRRGLWPSAGRTPTG
jgi:hypothetical protein